MSNYSSMDGVLYCKTHFEQLFKESGNFSKNFQSGKHEKDTNLKREPSKLSSLFCGTQEKCPACNKTVYPLEKVTMEGESFHKSCFRCAHGGCALTHSSYAALDGILYCKHHFQQLFMEKGNYQHVIEAGRKSTAENDAHEVIPAGEAMETVAEEEEEAKPDSGDREPEEKAEEES